MLNCMLQLHVVFIKSYEYARQQIWVNKYLISRDISFKRYKKPNIIRELVIIENNIHLFISYAL